MQCLGLPTLTHNWLFSHVNIWYPALMLPHTSQTASSSTSGGGSMSPNGSTAVPGLALTACDMLHFEKCMWKPHGRRRFEPDKQDTAETCVLTKATCDMTNWAVHHTSKKLCKGTAALQVQRTVLATASKAHCLAMRTKSQQPSGTRSPTWSGSAVMIYTMF